MHTIRHTTAIDHTVDVRQLVPRLRHSTIFQTWKTIPTGDAILLINDHDPVPLQYQFAAEYKDQYQWDYLEKGPDLWAVRILKIADRQPVGKKVEPKPYTITPDSITLDVRPIFKSGGSPCGVIDEAVSHVKPDQVFRLIAPFEPLPLIAKLGRVGFTHHSHQQGDGSWELEFRRESGHRCCCSHEKESPRTALNEDIFIEACGMEPPEPLVRSLEALDQLKRGRTLTMHSNRKPMHLFEQLDQRGFAYDCTEQSDHTFLTRIWHLP
jgi:uncharacterized protein (DUF2249 family)